ncbi:MAG TPA: c-type cytochrome domain-containing protein, partial [Anaerolineales bacterium]|nr:c-type cytochrome domain-containing protein [Anaerolineales bacterium]
MKSLYVKIALFVLIVGLLTACGAQPTESSDTVIIQPTENAAVTEAPTELPAATDTAAPTETVVTEPAATEPAAATQPAVEGATVSFANDVMPIIQSRCINCHGGDRTEEGLSMNTHAEIMAGSDNGSVVTPGDAADS